MSAQTLPQWARTVFDTQVHHAFQGRQKLAGTCREKFNVQGKTAEFHRMGAGIARRRTAAAVKLEVMHAVHSKVTVTLYDWNASDFTDIFQAAEVAEDDVAELAEVIRNGLGRRKDQVIIDALIAAKTAGTITKSVAASGIGATNNLNVERILRAGRLLDDDEVDEDDRVMVVHARNLEAALLTEKVGSADYNTFRALAAGDLKTFAGFRFVKLGNRAGEGGLAKADTVRQCWAWQKRAIAVAYGNVKATDISWLGDYGSWIVSGFLKIGAGVIDGAGCVEVLCDEA